jgi:23S rRNA pseudouridine1911/1915/1917 synthase
VRAGDVIRLRIPPYRRKLHVDPQPTGDLPILFEDAHCVAMDKPAGVPVHPAGRHLENTVIHYLHRRYPRDDEAGGDLPRLLHRLDRETSGVLLASKHGDFHYHVGQAFEFRRVQKTYLAVVEGRVERDGGSIDLGIGPARGSPIRLKMEARDDGTGLPASTHYRVLRRSQRFSLLELVPKTGRQHQLRVHLAAIGHPIVGDKIYGPDENYFLNAINGGLDESALRRLVLPRQALHAQALEFQHPQTGRLMHLQAPLPADMAALL